MLGWQISGLFALPPEKMTRILDTELTVSGETVNRLVVESGDYKFLFLDRRTSGYGIETPYTILGFIGPFGIAGPIDLSGQLREAQNPLGYGLSGAVFQEQTGVELYSGREEHTRFGLMARVPDDLVCLGGYRDDEGNPHLFGSFQYGLEDTHSDPTFYSRPLLSGFVSITDLPEGKITEEWFPSKPRNLEGPLAHGGIRASWEVKDSWKGRITVSTVFSRPSHENPGVFAHLFGEYSTDLFEVKGLSGHSNTHYISPEGDRSTRKLQNALSAFLYPLYPFLLGMEWEEKGYRDRVPDHWFTTHGGIKGRNFRIELIREKKPEEKTWKLEGWIRSGPFGASLDASILQEDSGIEYNFAVETSYSSRSWELEFRGKGVWDPHFQVQGSISGAVKRKNWKLGTEVELYELIGFRREDSFNFVSDPFSYLRVSLFFSVRDSQRPMNKTSGSRVRP